MRQGLIYLVAVVSAVVSLWVAQGALKPASRGQQAKQPRESVSQAAPPKVDEAPKVRTPPPKQEKPFVLQMAPGITMEFQWIPPGEAMIGDPKEGIPRHEEKFPKPFYLGKTEVTQEQWDVVMATNPSVMKAPKLPVHRVQREDWQVFLKAMNEKFSARTGMRFSLPTEAQWEYACRAGKVVKLDTPDDPPRIPDHAWLGSNSKYEPHPVAQKKPNGWGLYDMQGNVAEWCSDVLSASAGASLRSAASDPADSRDDALYVVRGGNYRDGPPACVSTSRLLRRATVPLRYDGLRLMCEPLP